MTELDRLELLTKRLNIDAHHIDRLFRLSRDLLTVVDEDGTLLLVNPRWTEVLGYAPEEMIGKPFMNFVIDDDVERTKDRLNENVTENKGDESDFVNTYVTKGGAPIDLAWRSTKPVDGVIYAAARLL